MAERASAARGDEFSAESIARLRDETRGCRQRVHLNNAGASFMPRPVAAAIHSHLELEERVGGYEAAGERAAAIHEAYTQVARLLGTESRNIAFTDSATGSYARVLSAFDFSAGDAILTTTNDYVSNQIMFLSLAERLGLRVARAEDCASGEVDLEDLAKQIDALRPKLVAVTQMPTNSGLTQPVVEIGRICRERQVPYLVDACQAVGQVALDVRAIDCDFLTATSRKFLRGPRGYGFIYVADRALQQGYRPLLPDLRSASWTADDNFTMAQDATRFEYWEQPFALLLGTGEAARYALEIGLPRIASRSRRLAALCRSGLRDAGLEVLDRGNELSAILTVAIPGQEPQRLHRELIQRGINTSISSSSFAALDFARKGVEWALRLSPHYYNTEAEIEQALEALRELSR